VEVRVSISRFLKSDVGVAEGAKCAMFYTYDRTKVVSGAENSLHKDETGGSIFWGPEVIEENKFLFFRDDEIYHDVTPPVFEDDSGTRSIYVINWPAEPYRTPGNILRHEQGHRLFVKNGEMWRRIDVNFCFNTFPVPTFILFIV